MSRIDTERDFAPIDDVVEALESLPGINDDRPERQAAREQKERQRRIALAMVRHVAALTQTEIAEKMGARPTNDSQPEVQPDTLLSTMKAHFDAVGAEVTIIIRLGDTDHHVRLHELDQD